MICSSFIEVDGTIHECGCEDAPAIGSVFEPEEFIEKYTGHKWVCWKGLPDPDGVLEPDEEKFHKVLA